jgi:hypothetical protein
MTARALSRVALLYAALTVVMAYPFSLHPAVGVLSIGTDTDLYIWALGWDVHAFAHQPFAIFDANIFFPFRHTLAYSENVVGSALLAAPMIWITHNPMLAFNLVALLSVPLSALGAFVLARRLGASVAGATLCGIVFGFTPPRLLRLDQFHLTTIEWVPFSLAFLHGYFQTGSKRDLRLALALFTLQALTSGHGAAMLVLGMALVVGYHLTHGEPLALSKRLRDVGLAGALVLVPAALIYLPYREAQIEIGFRRALDDWSISTSSFFSSASHVQTWLLARLPDWTWLKQEPDAWLFPGVLPLLLAAAAFVTRRAVAGRRPEANASRYRWLYLVVLVVCLWFAVGPPYGIWRGVYWLPGLNFVRVPSRFMLLGMLALAVLAAAGFDRLAIRLSGARRVATASIVGALLLMEFAAMPFNVEPYQIDPPAIDRWMNSLPKPFAVVEVPLPDSFSVITQERRNTLYMLHSLAHFQPIVQGYSGIQPPGYETLHWQLVRFPDEDSLRVLARMGVKYAVEHVDLIPPSERAEVAARYERCAQWLTLVHSEGDGRVWSIDYPVK